MAGDVNNIMAVPFQPGPFLLNTPAPTASPLSASLPPIFVSSIQQATSNSSTNLLRPAATAAAGRRTSRSRNNVTTACDGCKLARSRCDGRTPCLRCHKRVLSCTYNQGLDRRQNRGSIEEIQLLTDRLAHYQRLVTTLRDASAQDAGHVLERLRAASTPTVSPRLGSNLGSPIAENAPHPATAPRSTPAVSTEPTAMNPDETAELIDWIRQDMKETASLSTPKLDSPERETSPPKETTLPRKSNSSLEWLLC